jgi:hypothetical protein
LKLKLLVLEIKGGIKMESAIGKMAQQLNMVMGIKSGG